MKNDKPPLVMNTKTNEVYWNISNYLTQIICTIDEESRKVIGTINSIQIRSFHQEIFVPLLNKFSSANMIFPPPLCDEIKEHHYEDAYDKV